MNLVTDLGKVWDVFVFSLSEQSDQLSQWRAYTSGGDGYSVGFDAHKLRDFARGSKFHLAPCEYNPGRQQKLVHGMISDVREQFLNQREDGVGKREASLSAISLIMDHLMATLPVLKHPTFAEENEWRLIHPITTIWNDEVEYRDGGD